MDVVTDTRDRIREEAVALFTERGYATTSLREIADRVGITKASLYYHYPSKQDLLAAVVAPLLTDWQQTVGEAERLPRTDGKRTDRCSGAASTRCCPTAPSPTSSCGTRPRCSPPSRR